MNMTKENNTFLKQLLFVFLFSMVLVYYELVFKIFTVGNIFSLGIGYLLASISKNRKVNRIVSACLILLTSIIYIIQFFVYKQFKQFYDIDTMTGGAGDALGSFTDDILRMIFEQGGIFVVILLLVPFTLYLIFSKKYLPA